MENNTSMIALSIIDRVKFNAIKRFLNDIGGPTENEYVYLYNIFARKTHKKILRSACDIFTDRNNQHAFIKYILLSNDDEFKRVYDSATCGIFEE